LHSLLNLPALLIVLGGTFGAVMVQTPMPVFKRAFKILPWIFRPPKVDFEEYRTLLFDLAKKARQLGLLSLESHLDIEKNPVLYKGLELLVVGVDKQTIRHVMESEIEREEYLDLRAAQVFESMGGYSPTIGILGAVLGLIQVMRNLADPGSLGLGIAVAFVATIYGVGFANLIFLPIANKLKSYAVRKTLFGEMIIEGMVAMSVGESPNMLQLKLKNFDQQKKNEITT
jgi:chemotaxis protein MotA